jgi:hypothetical protein
MVPADRPPGNRLTLSIVKQAVLLLDVADQVGGKWPTHACWSTDGDHMAAPS